MYKIRITFIMFLISFFAANVMAEEPKMFFAEYRYIHPEIKEGSFASTSRKIWRIGFRYLRLEEKPDPVQNIHSLIISKAPDTYIINRYTNSGQHIIDRAENTDVHVPVFQSQDLPEEIQDLEMGYENAFFTRNNALSMGLEIIEGIECDMFQTTIKDFHLTLLKRKDNGNPFQVGIKKGNIAYSVRYITYELNVTPDFSLFEVPQDIKILEAN
jgi:hypothetical protein